MYKVLVIDDEVLVRVGLKTTIDWEDIGFTVVAEASSGEQGFAQYQKHSPDVVITDIRMPRGDGLWLIEKIRKENQDVKILVLTCYDEFSYARKALKLGADDYILKSEVEDEELIRVMEEIKNKIEVQQKEKNIQNRVKNSRNEMKRSLLNDLIKNWFTIDEKMVERCAELEFKIVNTKLALANLVMSKDINPGEEKTPNLKQVNNAILNIIFDQLADKEIDYLYNNHGSNFILLMAADRLDIKELKRIFRSVSNAARQYFDMSLKIIYTDPVDDLEELSMVYKDFKGKTGILFYESGNSSLITNINNISFREVNVFDLKEQYNHLFNEYIGKGDAEKASKLNQKVSNYFKENNINPMITKIFYSNLIGDIFDSYGQLFEGIEEIKSYEDYHYKVINADSLKGVVNLFADFAAKVIEVIRDTRNTHTTLIVNRALNYIKNNFDRKISLEDIARELNVSKQYLCSVFREETGETTSFYINRLRIEKAKKLLLKDDYRIKEIFEKVGFSNQYYFSKVFKKMAGMTITEYRESKNS